ncbi:MAG: methylmalonyl-CoA mutase family protein [Bacteroidales bacterium]|nr:methylmalonyl-CoA mutase family protein [Bacteroidales bacterium]
MEHNVEKLKFIEDFPPVSTDAWEQLILQDLKGADYEKKLVWKTPEGLKLKPYYRNEDLKNLNTHQMLPCMPPFVRGNKVKGNNWLVRQEISDDNPVTANENALKAIESGAESIALNVSSCKKYSDISTLLKGIDLNSIDIHFYGASSYLQLSDFLVKACADLNFDCHSLKGSFNFDSLGYYIANGTFYASLDSNYIELQQLLSIAKRDFPQIKVVNVNAHRIHNAGGLLTQEIAYALSMGVEYLSNMISKGEDIDDVAQRMMFTFGIGSNYFLEIAKIRTLRLLWSAIVKAYNPKSEKSMYMQIHSITGTWNKTIFDPYVNMLRATTEAMSAAIGGCDVMTVVPFDATYKKADNLSQRVSRNIQIILKEEAYFNKVVDVSAGSYYIENLTDSLAEASWKLFLDIESKGGFVKFSQSGDMLKSINEIALQKQDDLAKRKEILLGTNQYPNYSEKMLDKIEPKADPLQLSAQKDMRLAKSFEALRLATEDFVKRGNPVPKVFLLPVGNVGMRKARASFALNFFACAGYKVIDNNGFNTIDEGVKVALDSKAEIIVICSSDEEYATLGVELCKHFKEKSKEKLIVVAGNPTESIDALRSEGVYEFIHMRSNVLSTLQKFNSALGVL